MTTVALIPGSDLIHNHEPVLVRRLDNEIVGFATLSVIEGGVYAHITGDINDPDPSNYTFDEDGNKVLTIWYGKNVSVFW
jgi:hypothetical protein